MLSKPPRALIGRSCAVSYLPPSRREEKVVDRPAASGQRRRPRGIACRIALVLNSHGVWSFIVLCSLLTSPHFRQAAMKMSIVGSAGNATAGSYSPCTSKYLNIMNSGRKSFIKRQQVNRINLPPGLAAGGLLADLPLSWPRISTSDRSEYRSGQQGPSRIGRQLTITPPESATSSERLSIPCKSVAVGSGGTSPISPLLNQAFSSLMCCR